MSYSQLSALTKILNRDQLDAAQNFLNTASGSSKITASKFAVMTSIDISLATRALKALVDNNLLAFHFVIRCHECGLLLVNVDTPVDIDKEIFCYNCETDIIVSTDDIEIFYTFTDFPFVTGQQKNSDYELVRAVVQYDDSLTRLLTETDYDFNSLFYSPSDQDYANLEMKFSNIFMSTFDSKVKLN